MFECLSIFTLLLLFIESPKVFLSGSLQSGLLVKRGCEIRLDARISGAPYPSITWMRNDLIIRPETPKKRPEKPVVKKKKEKEPKEEVKDAKEAKEEAPETKEGAEKKEPEAKEKEAAEAKDKPAAEDKDKEAKDKEAKKEEKAPEEEVEEPEEPFYPPLPERLTINNSRRGESTLIIRDSVRSDFGVFSVRVENDHGICTATCEVNVLGKTCFTLSHSNLFYSMCIYVMSG